MNYFSDIVYRGKTVSDIRNELENFIRLPNHLIFSPSLLSPLLPITSCAVEIDIVANEILNPILSSNGSKKIFNIKNFIFKSSFLKILCFSSRILPEPGHRFHLERRGAAMQGIRNSNQRPIQGL